MKTISLIGILFFSVISWGTSQQDWKSPVGLTCYMDDFEPDQFPWKDDKCLNYEEVFKNYQYVETTVSKQTKVLTVKFYKAGQLSETRSYLIQDNLKLKPL